MSAAIWLLFSVVFGAVLGITVGLQVSKRLSWYLPSTSLASLAYELSVQSAKIQMLSEEMQRNSSSLTDSLDRIEDVSKRCNHAEDMINRALLDAAVGRFRNLPEDITTRISRDVARQVISQFSQQLVKRFQTLGTEYVLLRDLSGCEVEVSLNAGYTDWKTLQAALRKVEKFRPATRKDGENVHVFDESRQFAVYMDKLGEVLFDLKWTGKMQFQVKSSSMAV